MASEVQRGTQEVRRETPTTLWTRRLIISLTILTWIVFAALFFWLVGHVIRTVILLAIGALIAYAVVPLVRILMRVMPRWVAILIVYLLIFTALGIFLYYVVLTAVHQLGLLARYVRVLSRPGNPQLVPITDFLNGLGISTEQVRAAEQQVLVQLEGVLRGVVPFVQSFIDVVLDILVVAILSIYFLIDGARIANWLRTKSPVAVRGRVNFLIDLLQTIVGGYIRGQLIMAAIIGVLVGGGMQLLGVPLALLLGVLAFLFEFAPIIGTIITGTISVLLALTNGWVAAVIVLVYFLFVHALEAYIIGPRILGESVKIHPIVSLCAVIAGGELYGVLGIVFAAPLAGLVQAMIVTLWHEWRAAHQEQFVEEQRHTPTEEVPGDA